MFFLCYFQGGGAPTPMPPSLPCKHFHCATHINDQLLVRILVKLVQGGRNTPKPDYSSHVSAASYKNHITSCRYLGHIIEGATPPPPHILCAILYHTHLGITPSSPCWLIFHMIHQYYSLATEISGVQF